MMKKFLLFFTLLTLSLASCHENDEPVSKKEWPDSNHSLLIYMIGDNNLSTYCELNGKACINGMLSTQSPVNLIIYEDGKSTNVQTGFKGKPVLYRLKRNYDNRQKVDTILIHQFDVDHDSTDPEIMQSIINEAFAAVSGSVKGLELWSHGLGWAPSPNYKATRSADTNTRAAQYFGEDDSNYLEIWDLRKALERTPHLDYVIFDACNMSQVEVAYELRNVADYMLACPTEIMAQGLPYADLIKDLSSCNSKESLLPALKSFVDDYAVFYPGKVRDRFDNYVDGGTFAISDLSKVAELRQAYKALVAVCEDRCQLLHEHAYTYEGDIQAYGRTAVGSRYDFYDLMDYANFLTDNWPGNYPEYATLQEAINKVIVKEYHSEHVLDFKTMRSCGLGVGIPEIFTTTATNANTLMSAYDQLQWVKD